MATGLLEEDLELPARDFSDPVNLFNELLQERPDVPLEERSLVGANCCEHLRLRLAFLDNLLHQRGHGCHCLFSDPAADVASPVELVVVQGVEEGIHD